MARIPDRNVTGAPDAGPLYGDTLDLMKRARHDQAVMMAACVTAGFRRLRHAFEGAKAPELKAPASVLNP